MHSFDNRWWCMDGVLWTWFQAQTYLNVCVCVRIVLTKVPCLRFGNPVVMQKSSQDPPFASFDKWKFEVSHGSVFQVLVFDFDLVIIRKENWTNYWKPIHQATAGGRRLPSCSCCKASAAGGRVAPALGLPASDVFSGQRLFAAVGATWRSPWVGEKSGRWRYVILPGDYSRAIDTNWDNYRLWSVVLYLPWSIKGHDDWASW